MKLLVVDDDPAILKFTKKILELEGYEVGCCENALDAIQTLGDLTYDILITDATMPAFSGFDLIRSVRKTTALNYLSIAMLTGRSDKEDIERAVELGVQDYIVKPLDPMVFMEKVKRLVERHRKKKAQKPTLIEYNAEMQVPVKILRVTDIGISIETPYPLEKGFEVIIDFQELKDAGFSQNRFKALFNGEKQKNGKVHTELLLLGLSTEEQSQLVAFSKKWSGLRVA